MNYASKRAAPFRAGLLLVGVLAVGACGSDPAESMAPSLEIVMAELQAQGEVRVAVSLNVFEDADPAVYRKRIAEVQDVVLAALEPSQYRDVSRLEAVPAMGLTLLAEEALSILQDHPLVRSVGPDASGTG